MYNLFLNINFVKNIVSVNNNFQKKNKKIDSGLSKIVNNALQNLISAEQENDINGKTKVKSYLSDKSTKEDLERASEILKYPWVFGGNLIIIGFLIFRAIVYIPGLSCPSKSLFSIAKHLLTDVKNKTSPKKANTRIFGQSLYGIKAKL